MMGAILTQFRHLLNIKSLWLYLYIFKAVMAFLVALPLFITVDSVLSTSLFGKSLIESWDVSVFTELLALKSDAIAPIIFAILAGLIIYTVLMQFANGGLYYLVVSRKLADPGWKDFFAEGGVNFFIHVKITLIMLIVYALLIPAGMFFVNLLGLIGGRMSGTSVLWLMLLKFLVMMFILTAASIFSDSARAASAAYPGKNLREILRHGADFFKPRLGRLFLYYIVTYLPFFIIWLLVEWLALKATGGIGGMVGILIEFLLFQLAAASRTGQKLWYLIVLGKEFHSVNPGRFVPEQTELRFD